jgi:hypothetical protein
VVVMAVVMVMVRAAGREKMNKKNTILLHKVVFDVDEG